MKIINENDFSHEEFFNALQSAFESSLFSIANDDTLIITDDKELAVILMEWYKKKTIKNVEERIEELKNETDDEEVEIDELINLLDEAVKDLKKEKYATKKRTKKS